MTKLKKLLYKANDVKAKVVYSFVSANTNKDAFTQLKALNYENIRIYENATLATDRPDLEEHKEKQLAEKAKLDIHIIEQPSFLQYIVSSFKLVPGNQRRLLIGLVLLSVGLYFDILLLSIVAMWIILFVPYIIWSHYMFYDDIKHMHKSYMFGNWEEAQRIVSSYKYDGVASQEYIYIFDTMEARLKSINYSHETSSKRIEEEYLYIKDVSAYDYYLLLVDIGLTNGDYTYAMEVVGKTLELYPNSESMLLYKAMLLLEQGETNEAQKIVDSVEPKYLAYLGELGTYYLAKGLLENEKTNGQGMPYFTKAKEIYDIPNLNPPYYLHAATIRAYYALGLCEKGEKEKAKILLDKEWKVLSIHGSKTLHKKIVASFPEYEKKL